MASNIHKLQKALVLPFLRAFANIFIKSLVEDRDSRQETLQSFFGNKETRNKPKKEGRKNKTTNLTKLSKEMTDSSPDFKAKSLMSGNVSVYNNDSSFYKRKKQGRLVIK